jgi:quinol monooxygenase YgiN
VAELTEELAVGAYGLCGRLVATPGRGDDLASYLLAAASALEDVASCLVYIVNRDPAEPDAIWVVECWGSPEAHAASLALPAVQTLIAQARPIIASMDRRVEFEPVGGKGLVRGRD